MNRDQLFLIRPDFQKDGKGPYYCPSCVEALGLLESYPALKPQIEVRWVDFARPRAELVGLIGEENQSCPVLILAQPPESLPAEVNLRRAKGRTFVEGVREIGRFWSQTKGTGTPLY